MRGKLRGFLLAVGASALLFGGRAQAAGWATNQNGYQVYQNDDGSTVTNSWIKAMENGRTIWYYATNDGSLRMDGWQRVGSYWYYFDGNGVMQTGWVDNNNYYCDENGVMKTGWKQLTPPSDFFDGTENRSAGESYWFYFNTSTGEKFHANGSGVKVRSIDGVNYGFDEYGVMQTGWASTEGSSGDIRDYMYFATTSGKFKLGERLSNTWLAVIGPEESGNDGLSTGSVEWYYFKSSGHPAAGSAGGGELQKINGKRYLFNEKGNPMYGIQRDNEGNYYYCGSSKTDCSVRTGRLTLTEDDGDRVTAYFGTNGQGVTGVKDSYVYFKGKLLAAGSDSKYMQIQSSSSVIDGYVVDTSGRVVKNRKNLKDKNGVRFSVDSSGRKVTYPDGGTLDTIDTQDKENELEVSEND